MHMAAPNKSSSQRRWETMDQTGLAWVCVGLCLCCWSSNNHGAWKAEYDASSVWSISMDEIDAGPGTTAKTMQSGKWELEKSCMHSAQRNRVDAATGCMWTINICAYVCDIAHTHPHTRTYYHVFEMLGQIFPWPPWHLITYHSVVRSFIPNSPPTHTHTRTTGYNIVCKYNQIASSNANQIEMRKRKKDSVYLRLYIYWICAECLKEHFCLCTSHFWNRSGIQCLVQFIQSWYDLIFAHCAVCCVRRRQNRWALRRNVENVPVRNSITGFYWEISLYIGLVSFRFVVIETWEDIRLDSVHILIFNRSCAWAFANGCHTHTHVQSFRRAD